VIVAGRVGAAFTARIGTMKVSEEILALETMAINPVRYLVVNRFIGMIIALPALTLLANFTAVLGGFLFGSAKLGIRPDTYLRETLEVLMFRDLYSGMCKAAVFAVRCPDRLLSRTGHRRRGGRSGKGNDEFGGFVHTCDHRVRYGHDSGILRIGEQGGRNVPMGRRCAHAVLFLTVLLAGSAVGAQHVERAKAPEAAFPPSYIDPLIGVEFVLVQGVLPWVIPLAMASPTRNCRSMKCAWTIFTWQSIR
jgi:hypothetical protein